MSYAVIQTGGKQYKVRSGEILKIEKLPNSKSDSKIEFKEILAYGDDKVIEIGAPTVQGAKVEANLIKNSKNRTILIFKKRIINFQFQICLRSQLEHRGEVQQLQLQI